MVTNIGEDPRSAVNDSPQHIYEMEFHLNSNMVYYVRKRSKISTERKKE
jgi:hypothetical protein